MKTTTKVAQFIKAVKYTRYTTYLLGALAAVLLPVAAFAAGGVDGTGSGSTLPNPLGSNINTIGDLVVLVLNNVVLPIGSVVVVFFIILSGFKFVTARGSEDKLEDAKKMFFGVVIGAAILFGSVAIAAAIKGTLCQIDPNTCHTDTLVGPPAP